MKNLTILIAATAIAFAAGCRKQEIRPHPERTRDKTQTSSVVSSNNTANRQGNTHGIGSAIPAYYDSSIFNIIFVEFPSRAEQVLIANNSSINVIYQSDNGLPHGQPFISVIDAIPGDGMNPVWREAQIVFNEGFIPHQFYSDEEILDAAAGSNPEITINLTDEVYSCPVLHK